MREFQVFVTDDRYSVTTLYIIQAASAARACELAEGIFSASLHHLGVELFDDGACILTLGAVAPVKREDLPARPGRREPKVE